MKITAVVAALGAVGLLAACSSGSGSNTAGSSALNLTEVGTPSTHTSPAASKPTSKPTVAHSVKPTAVPTPSSSAPVKTVAVKTTTPTAPKTSAKPARTTTKTSLPTPTGPVTLVSSAYQYPFNCREHAYLVDSPADVSAGIDVTLLLKGVSADSLSIVPANAAVATLPNASSLVGSKSVGHGLVEATYLTYVSLFAPTFAPVTVSSWTVQAPGSGYTPTTYTVSLAKPMTVTLSDCKD